MLDKEVDVLRKNLEVDDSRNDDDE